MNWMIYGANGYTGELIAREAKTRGLTPVLAGRTSDKIAPLARELGFEHRVFSLDSPDDIARDLDNIGLVLHCAGPFAKTSAPMIEGCLRVKAHYLDITGEIAVFEHAHSRSGDARTAGVVLCPGVGFDVVPTDCVAATLKAALPDADHLALGFESSTTLSAGTAKTTVEGIPQGGKIRQGGKIVDVPHGYRVRHIDFGRGERLAMSIPWGDVATAYYTTGIPNIEVYTPSSRWLVFGAKQVNHFRWLLGWAPVQNMLKSMAAKSKGPTAEQRGRETTYIWGEATSPRGDKKTARLRTANGYAVTITAALGIVEHLLRDHPSGGTYTPAKLMGADFITKLPGSSAIAVE